MKKRFTQHSVMPLAVFMLSGLSAYVYAAEPPPVETSSTTVNISATVLNSTCEVDASTPWHLENVKVSDIINQTGLATQPETITLKNCGTGVEGITVSTQDSNVDAQGLIANQSQGATKSNVKAEIVAGDNATQEGTILKPSNSFEFKQNGNDPLKFNVKLLSAEGVKPTAGDFTANVALKLEYE